MDLSNRDEIFLGVMKETGHIMSFLDAVFGFLYRCTDFYQVQEDPSRKLGFPAGLAEKLALKMFRKWEVQAREDEDYYNKRRMGSSGDVPPTKEPPVSGTAVPTKVEQQETAVPSVSDSYNGAVLDSYRWSQTITDLDVQVPVPSHIRKARDVQVKVMATSMCVTVRGTAAGEWSVLMEGDLCWRNNKDESLWSLESGRHVQVHLEKSQEQWWDRLLITEPKIDLSHIDASRSMNDLPQDEQMKIQELVWNQERKMQGLPTSDQLAAENILKEAWSKKGSPFLGTEYDPSVINYPEGSSDPV